MEQSITTVIVTYNSEKTIKQCLISLPLKDRFLAEIIVVDNNSKDRTRDILNTFKKNIPNFKVVKSKKNIGFAKGCNVGAQKAKGKYLVFLNPDTKAIYFDLMKLISFFNKHKNAGMIGFKFYNVNGSLQYSFGSFPTILKVVFDRLPFLNIDLGLQSRNIKGYKKTHKVDWVSGSGFAISKSLFNNVNGFDEKIFMYGEDIEIGKRIEGIGKRNYYFPEVVFTHVDSGKNLLERNPHKYFSMRKGFLYFFQKKNQTLESILFLIFAKIESIVRLVLLPFKLITKKQKKVWQIHLLKTLKL